MLRKHTCTISSVHDMLINFISCIKQSLRIKADSVDISKQKAATTECTPTGMAHKVQVLYTVAQW